MREHKKVSAAFCNFEENASGEIRNEKRIKENCRETFLRIIYALRDFHHVMDVQGGLCVNFVTRFERDCHSKTRWTSGRSNVIAFTNRPHPLPQLHRKSIKCNTNLDVSHKAQMTRGKCHLSCPSVAARNSIKKKKLMFGFLILQENCFCDFIVPFLNSPLHPAERQTTEVFRFAPTRTVVPVQTWNFFPCAQTVNFSCFLCKVFIKVNFLLPGEKLITLNLHQTWGRRRHCDVATFPLVFRHMKRFCLILQFTSP